MSENEANMTSDGVDARLEALVIQRVLDLHPTHVTTEELVRDLAGTDDDVAARDGIERAIVELIRSGLLHPVGDDGFLTPTRAAVHLGELLGPVV
ncbi:MAG: hypothetical protein JST53_06510 [Actinobacteria bacterium]|nr:hypothetical protein [Actinomycetota bacterium]